MMVSLTEHKKSAKGKSGGSCFCSGDECESEHPNFTHGKNPPNTPNKSKVIMSQAAAEERTSSCHLCCDCASPLGGSLNLI